MFCYEVKSFEKFILTNNYTSERLTLRFTNERIMMRLNHKNLIIKTIKDDDDDDECDYKR